MVEQQATGQANDGSKPSSATQDLPLMPQLVDGD